MNAQQQAHYQQLYDAHLNHLLLQGKRPATIDAYARAVRRITAFYDCPPDLLSLEQLKAFFVQLIKTHSWSTVKLDRNGLQFFYHYTLNRQWEWLDIVKPPQVKTLPDVLSVEELEQLLNRTKQLRYQIFFFTLYSLGLRLGEGLSLTVSDIDSAQHQVHVRNAKGGKDRLVPLPIRTLRALRMYWQQHKHPSLLFPGQKRLVNKPMPRGSVQKALKQVCAECSIHKHISPHSLRHCYATHLLQQGLDLRSLQALLGHNSLNTTARYTRLTSVKQADTESAVNQLANGVKVHWEDS